MIYLGDNEPTIYLGDNIPTIYLGDSQIYPTGPIGVKINKTADLLDFSEEGSAKTVSTVIKVRSDDDFNILKDSNATWLTLSQNSGHSGKTEISLSAFSQTSGTYVTTLTAMTVDSAYSATCVVTFVEKYKNLQFVDNIHATEYFSSYSGAIITNQTLTMNTVMRIKFTTIPTPFSQYDRLVGLLPYTPGDTKIDGSPIIDTEDYRFFWALGGQRFYDIGSKRWNSGKIDGDTHYDLTLGNKYIYDNVNSEYWESPNGPYGSFTTQAYIRVDVAGSKIESLEISDSSTGNVLFNGVAAYDGLHVGLYDTVSYTMFYNDNFPMSYELNGTVYDVQ